MLQLAARVMLASYLRAMLEFMLGWHAFSLCHDIKKF